MRDEVSGMEEEHLIPHTKHLIVQRGDHVIKGQQLTDGLSSRMKSLKFAAFANFKSTWLTKCKKFIVCKGVDINDKHIEIIVRQMLKKVRVIDPGDTSLLYGEEVDKKEFEKENPKVIEEGGKAAQATPVLLGYHKSIAEHRILYFCSILPRHNTCFYRSCLRRQDRLLVGFKENVIMGHIIPGGTGFERHKRVKKFVDRELEEPLVFEFEDIEIAS